MIFVFERVNIDGQQVKRLVDVDFKGIVLTDNPGIEYASIILKFNEDEEVLT